MFVSNENVKNETDMFSIKKSVVIDVKKKKRILTTYLLYTKGKWCTMLSKNDVKNGFIIIIIAG